MCIIHAKVKFFEYHLAITLAETRGGISRAVSELQLSYAIQKDVATLKPEFPDPVL